MILEERLRGKTEKRVYTTKGEGNYKHPVISIYVRSSVVSEIKLLRKKLIDKSCESNTKASVEENVSLENIYTF